jgi:3-hydroxyisobutyrate dehydrogenase-like beta-hydroxyacid dehydrogenase
MLGHRGQNMLDGLLRPPTSTINIFVKDMGIVTGEAENLGTPVPLASLVEQQFVMGQANGWGSDDDSRCVAVSSSQFQLTLAWCDCGSRQE